PCLLVSAHAHPVPTFSYDRSVQVKLTAAGVEVKYQLNVDEITIFRDVTRIVDDDERAKLRTGNEIRAAFAKAMAPLLADRLEASLDGKPLSFTCAAEPKITMVDHVQYDFVFRAPWPQAPEPGQIFRLEENNFADQKGTVDLTFDAEQGLTLSDR